MSPKCRVPRRAEIESPFKDGVQEGTSAMCMLRAGGLRMVLELEAYSQTGHMSCSLLQQGCLQNFCSFRGEVSPFESDLVLLETADSFCIVCRHFF